MLKCSHLVAAIFQDYCDPEAPLSLKQFLPPMCEASPFLAITHTLVASSFFISSFTTPAGSAGVACMIEMTADGKPPLQKKDLKILQASQVGTHTSSFKHY